MLNKIVKNTVLVSLSTLAIFGCSDPKKANEKNFEKAINDDFLTYKNHDRICTPISTTFLSGKFDTSSKNYKLLASKGLLTGVKETANCVNSDTIMCIGKTKMVEFTSKGSEIPSFYDQNFGTHYLCIATVEVDKINHWEEHSGQYALVNYSTKISKVASWSTDQDILTQLSLQNFNEPKRLSYNQVGLKLFNDGWHFRVN